MRVVFLGTPEFALPALEALAARGVVALVVAQPDKPQGRGRAVAPPPVKERALALGLPVLQASRPNRPGTIGALRAMRPDLFVVVAFGAILSPELLAVPRLGAINLHASLLPEYRGASPIQQAILDGRESTGNTTMWMDEGLDTGDLILARTLSIGPDETAGELSARLATDGAELLVETLERVAAGDAPRVAQDEARASRTHKIAKTDGALDFTQPARAVHDRARAMTPWPGAVAAFAGQAVRFERTRVADGTTPGALPGRIEAGAAAPGDLAGVGQGGGLLVRCGDGAIEVLRVRPAGRKEMDALAWWRGLRVNDATPPRFERVRIEDPA
jgi:methionyl-tRNA formyltransferase